MILNLHYKILSILQRHVTLHVLISSEFWQPNILLTFMTILPPSLASSIFKCWRLVRRFKLFYIVLWFSHHLKREYKYKLGLKFILYVAFINNLISKTYNEKPFSNRTCYHMEKFIYPSFTSKLKWWMIWLGTISDVFLHSSRCIWCIFLYWHQLIWPMNTLFKIE